MTVAIARQRFLAIKYPFKYGRKNNCQVPIYVASVSILALIATISTFFEFTVEQVSFDNYDYLGLAYPYAHTLDKGRKWGVSKSWLWSLPFLTNTEAQ